MSEHHYRHRGCESRFKKAKAGINRGSGGILQAPNGTTTSTAVITAPYQHTSSVTKEVETRQRAATSEFLCSAHKQGLSSESQQHPGATGLLLYSGSAHFRRLCTCFPARGGAHTIDLPAAKDRTRCLRQGWYTPWVQHLATPSRDSAHLGAPAPATRLSQPSRCAERDNIQQPVDTQTQLRAGDHTGSPSEQSAVVCRAAAGVKSH